LWQDHLGQESSETQNTEEANPLRQAHNKKMQKKYKFYADPILRKKRERDRARRKERHYEQKISKANGITLGNNIQISNEIQLDTNKKPAEAKDDTGNSKPVTKETSQMLRKPQDMKVRTKEATK
jgi:hypothetical protein